MQLQGRDANSQTSGSLLCIIGNDEGRKTYVIFFFFVVAIVVYDFQKVVLVFFFPLNIYSLFILSPKALETILYCFDFVHGRMMK